MRSAAIELAKYKVAARGREVSCRTHPRQQTSTTRGSGDGEQRATGQHQDGGARRARPRVPWQHGGLGVRREATPLTVSIVCRYLDGMAAAVPLGSIGEVGTLSLISDNLG